MSAPSIARQTLVGIGECFVVGELFGARALFVEESSMNDLSSAMQRVDADRTEAVGGAGVSFVQTQRPKIAVYDENDISETQRRAEVAAQATVKRAALAAVKDEVDTIATLLAERGKQHGEFNDQARITQNLKGMMIDADGKSNWARLTAAQKESLEQIAHKIGRILAGNPNHRDHWDDISGYARLAADRIGALGEAQ